MAEVFTLLAVSFVGQIVWIFSPEVLAMVHGRHLSPLLVGFLCATGQLPIHTLLYFGGTSLAQRLPWVSRKIERVRPRVCARPRSYLATTFFSALVGLPPIIAMTALAGSFGIGPRRLLAVTYAGRIIRFTTLAAGGAGLLARI